MVEANPLPATSLKCSKGHSMSYKTTAFERKCIHDGSVVDGELLFCNLCKDGAFSCSKGYFRCDVFDCDYDVCVKHGCYKKTEKKTTVKKTTVKIWRA